MYHVPIIKKETQRIVRYLFNTMTANKKWTKTHYELIAMSIWRSKTALDIKDKNKQKQQARNEAIKLIVTDLSASLANEDPTFNRSKFLSACGIEQ